MNITYKTAEAVCEGHPDKLCDKIADAILDAHLRKDKSSRVACEVMAIGKVIIVGGEITSEEKVDIPAVVRRVLTDVGLDAKSYIIKLHIRKQSADIAGGVDFSLESRNGDNSWYGSMGAGDQGTVYGYACDECWEKIPLPLKYAHAICRKLDECRKSHLVHGILPDGKSQVTIEYRDGKPSRVQAIVVSIQHKEETNLDQLRSEVISNVLWPVFGDFQFDEDTLILVNPSGRFVKGGADADTGLTGRKLMVASYAGLARHGGGAFSGKDPTKVDRSGAYMARRIAKEIIYSGYATECEVSISYAIGKADPVAFNVDTFGTAKRVTDDDIRAACLKVYNLRPAAIIEKLHLRDTSYEDTATYGHFGNSRHSWDDAQILSNPVSEELEKHADRKEKR